MSQFNLTEEQALKDLRASWQPALRVPPTDSALDDPFPTPAQLIYVCLTTPLVIGNICLSDELIPIGHDFWAMGHISQEMLVVNQVDNSIYYTDYDTFAERDYAQFRPCARDFGRFLTAMLLYSRFWRDFYTDDTDAYPLDITQEELISQTLLASGIEDPTNILAQLY